MSAVRLSFSCCLPQIGGKSEISKSNLQTTKATSSSPGPLRYAQPNWSAARLKPGPLEPAGPTDTEATDACYSDTGSHSGTGQRVPAAAEAPILPSAA